MRDPDLRKKNFVTHEKDFDEEKTFFLPTDLISERQIIFWKSLNHKNHQITTIC